MSDDTHLRYRGSARLYEYYEVQQRSNGKRLGSVNGCGRIWEAVSDDGRSVFASTRRDAALALWPARSDAA